MKSTAAQMERSDHGTGKLASIRVQAIAATKAPSVAASSSATTSLPPVPSGCVRTDAPLLRRHSLTIAPSISCQKRDGSR